MSYQGVMYCRGGEAKQHRKRTTEPTATSIYTGFFAGGDSHLTSSKARPDVVPQAWIIHTRYMYVCYTQHIEDSAYLETSATGGVASRTV